MSAPLWTAAEVAAATGGTAEGDWVANGVSIDSRTLQTGDLFIPLPIAGGRDGHDFITDALAKGAAAVLIKPSSRRSGEFLIVPDTYLALLDLAKAGRARSSAKIIAVTGSVGKTGTKDALRHLLSQQADTFASAASLNNLWGAPLSLAQLPPAARYGVFELGMNHAGEIEPLSRMVKPHVAIITNIHAVHLGNFASLDDVARAKAEIFSGLEPDGVSIINAGGNCADLLVERAPGKILTFGTSITDAYIEQIRLEAECSIVRARILGNAYNYIVPVPGRHNADNSLGVLLTIAAAGGDLHKAANDYSTWSAVSGRGDQSTVYLPAGTITLIDETHNASPIATQAALKVLGMMTPSHSGRRIAVLGDMLELGPDSPRFHADLRQDIESAEIDLVFLSGSNMEHLYAALPERLRGAHAPDSTSLQPIVQNALRDGDIVLVKGSRGSKMKVITDALRQAGTPQVRHAV